MAISSSTVTTVWVAATCTIFGILIVLLTARSIIMICSPAPAVRLPSLDSQPYEYSMEGADGEPESPVLVDVYMQELTQESAGWADIMPVSAKVRTNSALHEPTAPYPISPLITPSPMDVTVMVAMPSAPAKLHHYGDEEDGQRHYFLGVTKVPWRTAVDVT